MNFDEADELRSTFTTYLAEGDKVTAKILEHSRKKYHLFFYRKSKILFLAFYEWGLHKSVRSLFEGATAETWW